MGLDWDALRTDGGGKSANSGELCAQLARYEEWVEGATFTRKGTPDAGLECFLTAPNGDEWGWQAKWFRHPPSDGQWAQVDKPVRTALDKHPGLVR